jgi:tRNA-2-methylthio-N6-dimethylallyladenosine synthase
MEAAQFDNVNSFIYSPHPNTEAASYEDTIPYEIKAERLQRVQQLAVRHGQERGNRY